MTLFSFDEVFFLYIKLPKWLTMTWPDLPNLMNVRNSLPTRSSLDVGGKAWVLKAEIGRRDDESDKDDDDDGLNH